ncbi:hypothetical protein ACIBG6_09580 [Streptomyces sp. NPDC050842]|uniref:hypothetical protein n=1 Tax=Streptomyces sp. NPDC050842 TaxID=3365636 RepID=UPI00378E4822
MLRRTYLIPPSSSPTDEPKGRMEAALEWIAGRSELPTSINSRARGWQFRLNGVRRIRRFSQRDIEENANARLPQGEEVSFRAIWMVEFYTPPDAGDMYRRLQQLDGVTPAAAPQGYAEWFKGARTADGGAWIRLPTFAASGQSSLGWGEQISAKLPEGVGHVWVGLMAVTHGISALVLRFEYDEDFAREYGELLCDDQGKRLERIGNGYSIVSPMFMKSRRVREWRRRRIEQASSWVSVHFPGHFTRQAEAHPAIQFVTTKNLDPWLEQSSGSMSDGYGVLDLRSDFTSHWESSYPTSLRFRRATERTEYWYQRDEALACAARESDLLSAEPIGVGSLCSSSVSHAMQGLDESLTEIAVRWGLYSYVANLSDQIADVRDKATLIANDATHGSFVALRNRLLVSGIESQLVAKEIVTFSAGDRWDGGGRLNEILPQALSDLGRSPTSFHSVLARSIARESLRISESEKEIRDLVSAAAGLTNAAYGIRLQAVVLWLTVVSVLVAIVALVVAFGDAG